MLGSPLPMDVTHCLGTPSVCLRNNRTMDLHVRPGDARDREATLHAGIDNYCEMNPELIAKWQPLLQANVADGASENEDALGKLQQSSTQNLA